MKLKTHTKAGTLTLPRPPATGLLSTDPGGIFSTDPGGIFSLDPRRR